MTTVGLLGGDKREELLISFLKERGYKLKVLDSPPYKKENVLCYPDIKNVIKNCDVVVAPMSSTDEDGYLKKSFISKRIKLDSKFVKLLDNDTQFFIGIARPILKKPLEERGISYVEMARLSDVAILNAIPTAEGAIKKAIEETDHTLFNSKVLISGLGNVGLTLAWRLKALGAITYSVTRDRGATARGRDLVFNMITYYNMNSYLSEIAIILNTVPAMIFNKKYLSSLKKNTIIIDLASAPGGTDFEAAKKLGIKAFLYLGIPGEVAPRTSAEIMAEAIIKRINSLK